MLVLGRKIGEEIMIGEDTRLVVLDVRGSTVRLGFVAPREIPIHRAETQLRTQQAVELEELELPTRSKVLVEVGR